MFTLSTDPLRGVGITVLLCGLLLPLSAQSQPEYETNGKDLIDLAQEATTKVAKKIPTTKSMRIAVVNMDGAKAQATNPSTTIADMWSIALTKRGVAVVERDVEALYRTLVEGWTDSLLFRIGPPCGTSCPAEKSEYVSDGPTQTNANTYIEPVERGDYPDLFVVGVPGLYGATGKPIVTTKHAATHILAYRIYTYGSVIESLGKSERISRTSRLDMMLRLIETKTGNLVWSERLQESKEASFDKSLRGALEGTRFSYDGPQFNVPDGYKPPAPSAKPVPKAKKNKKKKGFFARLFSWF